MAENLGKLMPDVGSLDEQINILQPLRTTGPAGGVTETWSALASNVWARVMDKGLSNEGFRGEDQQEVAFRITEFTVRAEFSIDETMRIQYAGQQYDILSILKVGRNRFLTIKSERRDNET